MALQAKQARPVRLALPVQMEPQVHKVQQAKLAHRVPPVRTEPQVKQVQPVRLAQPVPTEPQAYGAQQAKQAQPMPVQEMLLQAMLAYADKKAPLSSTVHVSGKLKYQPGVIF